MVFQKFVFLSQNRLAKASEGNGVLVLMFAVLFHKQLQSQLDKTGSFHSHTLPVSAGDMSKKAETIS